MLYMTLNSNQRAPVESEWMMKDCYYGHQN